MIPGRAVWAFVVERCLPVYPILLSLWVFATESITVVLADPPGQWRPTWDTALKVLALMSAGIFLRMVDDQKDLDYDRRHHPTRPLVQGRVSARDLRAAMVPLALATMALAAMVSAWAAVIMGAVLAYSLALWWTETRVAVVRDNALVNLIAVCPVQFLVTGLAMTGNAGWVGTSSCRLAAVPVVFTAALLHAEVARKTTRGPVGSAAATYDRHSYSALIGTGAAAAMACALGLLAVVTEVLITAPWSWVDSHRIIAWLPSVTAVLPVVSAWRFLRGTERDHPQGLPTVFVVAFFLSIIGQGLLR